ncbi:MAG TPA: hypothetical protein VKA96_00460 [Solirubrobacteraceae bacterium]|nr:hypothetical protein [Solirubrobacteraceae bacterium]
MRPGSRTRAGASAAAAAALVAAAAGCGGGGGGGGTSGASAPARPPTTAAPSQGPTARAPARGRHRRRAVPGGERPVRIRATFTVSGGRLRPRVVSVPPFLAVRVSAASADGRAHVVTIAADRVYRLAVPRGGRAALLVPGQRAGRYPVRAGAARATLVVGGEPGG